jgi:mitochondrial fission protein ELM1
VAVLVGGKSKAFDLTPARAAQMAAELDLALEQEQASLLLTFSRRTPDKAKAAFTQRLARHPGIVWDGEGDNPYFAFLAAADFVAVTEDSVNMAADAASTGKPVFILKMDGQSLRMRRFHEDLEARGAARPFGGAFYRWTYEPLAEADRAAGEILRLMDEKPLSSRTAEG